MTLNTQSDTFIRYTNVYPPIFFYFIQFNRFKNPSVMLLSTFVNVFSKFLHLTSRDWVKHSQTYLF